MPNLGQGGCQAIEDSYELAEQLCRITEKSQIPNALQEYYRNRIVRSAVVQGLSRLSSDIIISTFSTPFRLSEYFKEKENYKYLNFKSIGTWYLQPFLPLIFYAQFGFLYSFRPSVFSREEIAQLVDDSLKRNKAEVEKVYSFLAEGCNTFFSAKTMSFIQYDPSKNETSTIAEVAAVRSMAAVER